jgi:hypothetical protein
MIGKRILPHTRRRPPRGAYPFPPPCALRKRDQPGDLSCICGASLTLIMPEADAASWRIQWLASHHGPGHGRWSARQAWMVRKRLGRADQRPESPCRPD